MNKDIMKAAGFGMEVQRVEDGLCSTCGKIPGVFKDKISLREFYISGMCQRCQDQTFEVDYEDER
jgi:hypothetical protein